MDEKDEANGYASKEIHRDTIMATQLDELANAYRSFASKKIYGSLCDSDTRNNLSEISMNARAVARKLVIDWM